MFMLLSNFFFSGGSELKIFIDAEKFANEVSQATDGYLWILKEQQLFQLEVN